jgi:DNA-directed RNA polymerase sigma subunit (sigma70/sigma32)
MQQKSIRRILANPNTPYLIRTKTKNIVYEKYHYWSQNICVEYLKKRSLAELRPDLEQCISAGLLAAIDRYDWTRETSFPNYAKKYVLGALITGINKLCTTRNEISFVEPNNAWLFDTHTTKTAEDPRDYLVSKHDILGVLDPEERRLFEYMYGHVFEGGATKRSVAEICDLMAYGNKETMRIRKTRMFKKIVSMHKR